MALAFVLRSVRIVLVTPVAFALLLPVALVHHPAAPVILRRYLELMGGVFVKLGQFLAMRYDLLPSAWCQELSKLLDQIPPVPLARLVPSIERDIGQPVGQAFETLGPEPIGSASLAQVHLATLPGGERVVVKVKRPGTDARFRIDLAYLRAAAWLLQYLPFLNPGIPSIITEAVRLTRAELDFRREARNIAEMAELMRGDTIDHRAPRLYPELCGPSTLTMEYLEGVSMTEMLRALDTGDQTRLRGWAAQGITPRRAARLILRSVLEQTMHHRVFHADPHASNMILLPGGTLGWIDWGVLGWLDERLWRQQLDLREAIADGRIQRTVEIIVSMFPPVSRTQRLAFEGEVKDGLRDWLRVARSPHSTLAEKSSGLFFLHVMRAAHHAGMRIPTGLTNLFRAIVVSDVIMLRLDPALDWQPVVRAFVREEQERHMERLVRESMTVGYASSVAQVFLGATPTLLTVMNLIERASPKLERFFDDDLSRLETSVLLVLRLSRLGFGVVMIAAAGVALTLDGNGRLLLLLLAGLGLLGVVILSRLIRLYR